MASDDTTTTNYEFDDRGEAMRQMNGQLLTLDLVSNLVERLDEALFLEGPRFRQCLADPVRQPSCVGCYAGEPNALRRQPSAYHEG